MKHGTICRMGNILFDYHGKTKQGYIYGGHCVTFTSYYTKLNWIAGGKGNVISYTTKEFEVATPEEIEIFNNTINK